MSTPLLLEASSLIDALTDAMRRQIIAGSIPPGKRLTELWVSSTFQVARPTAKAALDRLTNEGMLGRGPRKSAIVPQLTADDVADIYFSREPVESCAVASLADQAQLPADAEYALMLMTVAARSDLHSAHTQADIAFHRALVSAIESPRLKRMHDTVMGEAQLCIAQVRSHVGLDLIRLTADHAAIADAIREGDRDRAIAALQKDLHGCRDLLIDDVRRAEERHRAEHVSAKAQPA